MSTFPEIETSSEVASDVIEVATDLAPGEPPAEEAPIEEVVVADVVTEEGPVEEVEDAIDPATIDPDTDDLDEKQILASSNPATAPAEPIGQFTSVFPSTGSEPGLGLEDNLQYPSSSSQPTSADLGLNFGEDENTLFGIISGQNTNA